MMMVASWNYLGKHMAPEQSLHLTVGVAGRHIWKGEMISFISPVPWTEIKFTYIFLYLLSKFQFSSSDKDLKCLINKITAVSWSQVGFRQFNLTLKKGNFL